MIGKTTAVILSGSISIMSSLVDSVVDFLSGLIIWLTTRAVERTDPFLYPRGKTYIKVDVSITLEVIHLTMYSNHSHDRNGIKVNHPLYKSFSTNRHFTSIVNYHSKHKNSQNRCPGRRCSIIPQTRCSKNDIRTVYGSLFKFIPTRLMTGDELAKVIVNLLG